MSDFKTQLQEARDERETGDAAKALNMFLQINKEELEPNQLFDLFGELGLTHWHCKSYEKAKAAFQLAKQLAEKLNNNSFMAMALRQLSRPELNEEDPDLAVQLAREARDLAYEAKRQDLVWFTHGVITALIFKGASNEELNSWFELEAKDLYESGRHTKDSIAKWVWICGMLIDRSKVSHSIGDLYLALIISDQFNLARRKEQIEKLISEFDVR